MNTPDAFETDWPGAHPVSPEHSVILVADDDVFVRNLVTHLLQRQGYVVLSASDGQEGLELSRKYPGSIDLLITDVEMPRLNGMDLSTHLLEERPRIKVIVMSGADMKEIVSQNVNLPFLPKPFDGEALQGWAAVSWAVTGAFGVPYLRGSLSLRPGEALVEGAYVAPELRGNQVAPRGGLYRLSWLRAAGYRRVMAAVLPENTAGLRPPDRLGYRRIGTAHGIGLGPLRRVLVTGRPARS